VSLISFQPDDQTAQTHRGRLFAIAPYGARSRDFRYGSIATELGLPRDVCFPPDSDRIADILDWQLRANNRYSRLFDHLVGAGEQRRRNGKTKRLCRLGVDHQLELCDLLHC